MINNEDSEASSASVSRNRPRRSSVIKAETAFASQLNTRISGLLDDGVRDFDILEDGDNGQSPSSVDGDLLKAATEFPDHRGPRLGASNHDHNHVTNQSAPVDGSVIEEHDPPSLPSPVASLAVTGEQSRTAPRLEIQKRYPSSRLALLVLLTHYGPKERFETRLSAKSSMRLLRIPGISEPKKSCSSYARPRWKWNIRFAEATRTPLKI